MDFFQNCNFHIRHVVSTQVKVSPSCLVQFAVPYITPVLAESLCKTCVLYSVLLSEFSGLGRSCPTGHKGFISLSVESVYG